MSFQPVEYFGMPLLAVSVNGTWLYHAADRGLVPFLFQQYVRHGKDAVKSDSLSRPVPADVA
jgi:hypothetical protein